MTLEELRARRAQAVAEMRALIAAAEKDDGRDLTDEEVATYDGLKAEVDKLDGKIDRLEDLEGREATLDAVARPAAARQQRLARPGGDPAAREFETLGEFMYAVRFRPGDQRLSNLYQEFEQDGAAAEQSMGVGSEGGFAVPTQFRPALLEVSPQDSIIRPRATVIPAGSPPDSAVTMPALDQTGDTPGNVYGGVEVSWIGEGAAKPETDATLREITLAPHEVAGHIKVTDKLLRNWQAAGPLLERLLRGAVRSAEDDVFYKGNGIAKPLGVINSGAAYVVNRAGANLISRADINAMTARILMRGGMPAWIASQSVMPQLQNLRNDIGSPPTGDGALVWNPDARDNAGNQVLGGRPILWHNRAPQLGTKGDLALVDLSYYLIKDGSGPFVAASEHVHFTSNKTVIKIFYNVDGQPWLTAPFKEENGYEVSPFVVLDVPA